MKCENCKWFVRNKPQQLDKKGKETGNIMTNRGSCRRYPPVFIEDNIFRYPVVSQDFYCGELKEDYETTTKNRN